MSFIKELWKFMLVRKKFWLLPILLMMALFGALSEITNNWPYRLTKSSKYFMRVENLYPELGIYG